MEEFSSMAFLSSFSTCWLMLDFIFNFVTEEKTRFGSPITLLNAFFLGGGYDEGKGA